MTNIIEVLKDAGRLEDILDLINKIRDKSNRATSLPLFTPQVDDNWKAHYRIDADLVFIEAGLLLSAIENKSINTRLDELRNLWAYVYSETEILLHNYTVSLSHRKHPKDDIDVIRIWCILENLIINIGSEYWEIADGWKKKID